MQPQAERNTTQRSEMLDAFRDALAPLGGSQSLEDKLQALTPSQRDMLLSTAKMVKMAMAGKSSGWRLQHGICRLAGSNVWSNGYCQAAVDCGTLG